MSEVRSETDIAGVLSHTPILMYHKVAVRNEVGINAIHPEKFRRQVEMLAGLGYGTITFQDLLYTAQLPPRPLIITFDDGYECIYEHAFPILRSVGFCAVVYVVTGFIGKWNRWDANLGGIRFRHLNRTQLREMDRAGWELGSHCVSHRALTRMSPSELEREMVCSKKQLSPLSSRPVVSVAYPFGMHNLRIQHAAQQAGYRFGCSGIRPSSNDAFFSVRRIPVYQLESSAAILRKLRRPLPVLESLKLSLLHLPARFVPLYQRLFKAELFLDL